MRRQSAFTEPRQVSPHHQFQTKRVIAFARMCAIASSTESVAKIKSRSDRLIIPSTAIFSSIFSRSEEHTSELQSHSDLVCRLLLEKKKKELLKRHSKV